MRGGADGSLSGPAGLGLFEPELLTQTPPVPASLVLGAPLANDSPANPAPPPLPSSPAAPPSMLAPLVPPISLPALPPPGPMPPLRAAALLGQAPTIGGIARIAAARLVVNEQA